MEIRCPTCGEPWDVDSLSDEVENRFSNKPWLVENKPEPYTEPDTPTNWCNAEVPKTEKNKYEICMVIDNDHIDFDHPFTPLMVKHHKSWNTVPHIDKDTGLWFDEREWDRLHDMIREDFYRVGCNALNVKHNETKADPAYAIIYDVMDDDLDAAAGFIEDADRWGLLE